jgi:hypothetical protein
MDFDFFSMKSKIADQLYPPKLDSRMDSPISDPVSKDDFFFQDLQGKCEEKIDKTRELAAAGQIGVCITWDP